MQCELGMHIPLFMLRWNDLAIDLETNACVVYYNFFIVWRTFFIFSFEPNDVVFFGFSLFWRVVHVSHLIYVLMISLVHAYVYMQVANKHGKWISFVLLFTCCIEGKGKAYKK